MGRLLRKRKKKTEEKVLYPESTGTRREWSPGCRKESHGQVCLSKPSKRKVSS